MTFISRRSFAFPACLQIALFAAAPALLTFPLAIHGLTVADGVEVERLGPGNFSFPLLGTTIVGDQIYAGSRNLTPSRITGFDLSTGRVTTGFELGNGTFVQSIVFNGEGALYAGVTHAQPNTNLYRIDLASGKVTEAAAVPGQSVAALAVAPDGIIYTTGRPEGRSRGPALFSLDPSTKKLTRIAVPHPEAGQALGLAATETTIYFGSGFSSAAQSRARIAAIDRATGQITEILPPEMARDSSINRMKIFDDILVVGGDQVGVMNLTDGSWRVTKIGSRQHQFAREGRTLFAAASEGVYAIDLESFYATHLGHPGKGLGSYQGLGVIDGLLFGTLSSGHVWTLDRSSGESQIHDLVSSGAAGGAEAGQSLQVLGSKVYVGGNNSVAVHDLDGGAMETLEIPGEVKTMAAVNETMYLATYSPAALWEHRPAEKGSLRRLGSLSANRPRDMAWDEVNKRVVIGVRSDRGGGTLEFYDPETEIFTVHRNPLGEDQWVWNIAPDNGIIFLGGANRGGRAGNISAWDPVAGKELWRLENPFGERGGISALTVVGDRLFGIAIGKARLFAIDIRSENEPKIVHVGSLAEFAPASTPLPRLRLDRDVLYGISEHSVFRIDPETFEATLLVGGLNADWFSGPAIGIGDDHSLYTLAGRELIRIRDHSLE